MSVNNDNHSNDSEDDNNSEQNPVIEEDTFTQSLHPSDQRNETPTIIPSTSASNMVSSLQSGIPVIGTIKKIGIKKGNEQGNKPDTTLVSSRRKKSKENEKIMAFLERQNKERTIHLNKLETCLQPQIVEDEIDLFFRTMAASVKKFPAQSQIDIKMNLSQMVFNEESRLNTMYGSPSMVTNNDNFPQFHVTSPASRAPSSDITSVCEGSTTSEMIPVATPSPNDPQLDSLTPYWKSFTSTNTDGQQ